MADPRSDEFKTVTNEGEDSSYYFSSDIDNESWTLQIKNVGEQEPDFTVTLHPDDELSQLYDEVSSVTGLSREQQRLIYRGRLLAAVNPNEVPDDSSLNTKDSSSDPSQNQKLKDIVGLTDGHTIHLVRKKMQSEEESNEGTNHQSAAGNSPSSPTSGNATSSLLSALLGVGSEERRNRRAPYRLREEDWIRPDPGSMESVRQGLLTLHTLLPASTGSASARQFYQGQWIDCRDTVNQWLEATVVNIVYPNELLPPLDDDRASTVISPFQPTTDSVTAVTDLEGRRRLLLVPCDESESEEEIDGIHYRRRDNNSSVQLLHVHYNGWPVRWDEWIRSDSERIRPFCVRTRHAGQYASPTVQASMQDAPRTHFTDAEDEASDRRALLPELHRIVGTVQEILGRASINSASAQLTRSVHLPWQSSTEDEEGNRLHSSRRLRQREMEALAPLLDRLGRALTDAAPHVAALAASVDQEADDGDEDDDDDDSHLETIEEHPSTLGGLLSLLSRDRRRHGQSVASSNAAVPSGDVSASLASSTTGGNEQTTTVDQEDDEEEEGADIVDPDHRDFVTGLVNTTRGDIRSGPRSSSSRSGSDEVASLLGAYLAAASLGGLTSVGVGDGDGTEGLGRLFRDRGNGGGGIDIHIHAVVTAPGFDGGVMGLAGLTGGGAGAPAFPTATPVNATNAGASGGLVSLFGSRDQQSPRRSGSRRFRASNAGFSQQSSIDDDAGIFAELYSETPEPINPSSIFTISPGSASAGLRHRDVETDSDTPPSPSRRSRSRSRSQRRMQTQGNDGSSSRSIGSQRRGGGMLGRFFRRNADNND